MYDAIVVRTGPTECMVFKALEEKGYRKHLEI